MGTGLNPIMAKMDTTKLSILINNILLMEAYQLDIFTYFRSRDIWD